MHLPTPETLEKHQFVSESDEESEVSLFSCSTPAPIEYDVEPAQCVSDTEVLPFDFLLTSFLASDMQGGAGNFQLPKGDEKQEEAWQRRPLAHPNRTNERPPSELHQASISYQGIPFGSHPFMGLHQPGHFSNAVGHHQQESFANAVATNAGQPLFQYEEEMGADPKAAESIFRRTSTSSRRPSAEEQSGPPTAPLFKRRASSSAQSTTTRRESIQQEETPLGVDFTPGRWHVLCGRSKHNFDHIGNRRLRVLVANKLKAYVQAPTRREKTDIISEVAEQVRTRCHGGGFVRKDKNGQWTEVGPTIAREKVSHAFRDSLLKHSRISREKGLKQLNRQRTWKEAQDEIFNMLHLQTSEPMKRDSGTEDDRRTSTTSTSAGRGVSTQPTILALDATTIHPSLTDELRMNQYQNPVQHQNRILMNRLQSSSVPRNGPNNHPGTTNADNADNADNDQILGNLTQGNMFLWRN